MGISLHHSLSTRGRGRSCPATRHFEASQRCRRERLPSGHRRLLLQPLSEVQEMISHSFEHGVAKYCGYCSLISASRNRRRGLLMPQSKWLLEIGCNEKPVQAPIRQRDQSLANRPSLPVLRCRSTSSFRFRHSQKQIIPRQLIKKEKNCPRTSKQRYFISSLSSAVAMAHLKLLLCYQFLSSLDHSPCNLTPFWLGILLFPFVSILLFQTLI